MKPVDHVNPTVPSNWVRRGEDKRRRQDPKRPQTGSDDRSGAQPATEHKHPPGPDPDGRTHLIDELA